MKPICPNCKEGWLPWPELYTIENDLLKCRECDGVFTATLQPNCPSEKPKEINDPSNPGEYPSAKIFFNPSKKPSLPHCLKELGAPIDEVYAYYGNKTRPKSNGNYKWAISDMNNAEILGWAEYLYKEAMKKYHPDQHPKNIGMYTEYCQYLGEMIQRVREIINGRTHR